MPAAVATFQDVSAFDGRPILHGLARGALRLAGMGLGSVAFVAVSGLAVTLAASWIFSLILSSSPHGRSPTGPGVYALDARFGLPGRVPAATLRPELALVTPSTDIPAPPAVAQLPQKIETIAPSQQVVTLTMLPRPRPHIVEHAQHVPLPRVRPGVPELASIEPARAVEPSQDIAKGENPAKVAITTPMVALVAPPPEPKPVPPPVVAKPQTAHSKAMALAGVDERTAVYDISARSVYLPNGQKLEAHSGLGEKMDDPSYIHVRMRGATPPNVYTLTMREKLFHGVRAIRLNPVDRSKMHGRDGILAHTYMLGPNGQSNGCVSFKDYDKFLNAFLDGQVDKMVVVANLDGKPPVLAKVDRNEGRRYASRGRYYADEPRGLFAAAAMPDMARSW